MSDSATSVESGFIDDRAFTATSFQWTVGFVPAVARWSGAAGICPVLEHFLLCLDIIAAMFGMQL